MGKLHEGVCGFEYLIHEPAMLWFNDGVNVGFVAPPPS
ncbi:hypothetical protein ACVWY5_006352 [Bradyrhizobium sp. USDA 3256]